MKIQAAVAHANRDPLLIEDIDIDRPRAGEILLRLVATGLCHTDLTVLDHAKLPWPAVLGHEGAGFYDFADINDAIRDARAGTAIKPVLRLPVKTKEA